jgi:FkbM family methyltransferase
MKIFLDVGTYKGWTLKIAMQYPFDKIYCFEPVPSKCELIRKMADERVTVFECGLWNKTKKKTIYNPETLGASLFKDKNPNLKKGEMQISVIRASEWFKKFLKEDDEVYLKMNCEGAEWAILDDLIKSGEYKKLKAVMVDFDIRKIPSQKHLMAEMKERLLKLNIPKMYFADEFGLHGLESHAPFTHFWIKDCI